MTVAETLAIAVEPPTGIPRHRPLTARRGDTPRRHPNAGAVAGSFLQSCSLHAPVASLFQFGIGGRLLNVLVSDIVKRSQRVEHSQDASPLRYHIL